MMTTLSQNGSTCKYVSAPKSDSEIEALDKTNRSCCQKCALASCVVGLFLVLGGIISMFIMRTVVNSKIVDNMVLFEGGEAFKGWTNPPVNPVMKIHFFNLTNKEAFLAGRERARVDKIGPYVYVEEIKKVGLSFSDDGEAVTFSDKKTYRFSQSLSSGSESDVIVMPNIPLLGALRTMADSSIAISIFVNTILGQYKFGLDKTPFLTLTVKEFLWGYPSLIMSVNTQQHCDPDQETDEDKTDFWGEGDDDDFWSDEYDMFDDGNNKKQSKPEKRVKCRIYEDSQTQFGYFLGEKSLN